MVPPIFRLRACADDGGVGATSPRRGAHAGFTLIELLVTLAILAVFLAVAVPTYVGFRSRATNSAAQANVRAALPAIEAYFVEHATYAGMTAEALRAYDPDIRVDVLGTPGTSGYCIRSAEPRGVPYYKQGPAGTITTTACSGP